jgi:hypothetical protein
MSLAFLWAPQSETNPQRLTTADWLDVHAHRPHEDASRPRMLKVVGGREA